MNHRKKILWSVLLILLLCWLTACDSSTEELTADPKATIFQATTTIPHHGQFNVVLSSAISIAFSEEIFAENLFTEDEGDTEGYLNKLAELKERIRIAKEETPDQLLDYAIAGRGQTILIRPAPVWEPLTEYRLTIGPGIESVSGLVTVTNRVVNFTTGVRRPNSAENLNVLKVLPGLDEDGTAEPCYDFQTFRIYFNEPVHRRTAWYGPAVRLVNVDNPDTLIPGNLFARGNQIVFDPENDLEPGKTYRLTVTTELEDRNGQSLAENYNIEYEVISTGNRVELLMDNCPTTLPDKSFCGQAESDQLPTSKFTRRPINTMFINSVLLGPTEVEVGGQLWSEFADGALFPKCVPFVVRKGHVIEGAEIIGKIGGEIPTGVNSGAVKVTLLTDSLGSLCGSEFIHGVPGLPPTVRMTMDAVQAMDDGSAVALLGQPIMGVTLVGEATVQDVTQVEDYQAMVINVAGYGEIELINEYIPVTMSLQMIPPPSLPEKEVDDSPLDIISVSPLPDSEQRQASDEVIVAFSKPIDPNSLGDATARPHYKHFKVALFGPSPENPQKEIRIAGEYDIYNPKVAFKPDQPLMPNTDYRIEVDGSVTDLLGNAIGQTKSYTFKTMSTQSSMTEPPLLVAAFPGLFQDNPDTPEYDGPTLPANFTANFYFSQIMDPDSFVYGQTYGFYHVSAGQVLVPGTSLDFGLFHHFIPDQMLVEGDHYQWVIFSNAAQFVTNYDGVALDTDRDRVPGGPDVIIDFIAGGFSIDMQSMLYTYPYADGNGDSFLNDNETATDTNFLYMSLGPLKISGDSYNMGYFPLTVSPFRRDEDGTPRVPIGIEGGSYIFSTSTSITLDFMDDKGLLDFGRLTMQMGPGSRSDLIPGSDGLTGVDVDSIVSLEIENETLNKLFGGTPLPLQIPSKLRFSADGRMMVFIEGESEIPLFGDISITASVKMTTASIPSRRGY